MATRRQASPSRTHLALAARVLSAASGLPAGLASEGPLPSRQDVRTLVNELLEVLFPESHRLGTAGGSLREHVAATLGTLEAHLETAIFLGLHRLCGHRDRGGGKCARRARAMTVRLLDALPEIRAALGKDVLAAYECDPAASGVDEIVACYPGLFAIAIYRVGHRLHGDGAQVVPRMLTEHAHSRTGIDIHPGATIGESFFIDHGTGIVIGETSRIGDRVRIYQGVTLGALSVRDRSKNDPSAQARTKQRHPTIEDEVTIYANATILGGSTVIGRGAVVGGNAWITYSVPPGIRVGVGDLKDTTTLSPRLAQLLREVSAQILEAQRPIRVLRLLAWDAAVERDFFAKGGRELPRPEYRISPDVAAAGGRFRALKGSITGDGAIEIFLRDTCDAFAMAARMLAAAGTRDFYHHAVELYGRPASLTADRRTTNLGLAQHFRMVVDGVAGRAPIPSPEDELVYAAEEVVPLLAARFARFFPGEAIGVEISDGLAAKAAAGVDGVRIKRGVRFSARELAQIEFHEGQVHVATALNGRAQPVMPFIGSPSPRTTATQEGLAVLTEFLTQSTSINRLRQLADRTLAIKMAEDGADFCQLYQFFVERGNDETGAFEGARRVCRGGLCGGGGPFTKDVCYLDGLLRVTNFLRVALVKGHLGDVPLFFAGKIAVEDVPLFGRLAREGLVRQPDYLPAWARDLSYLTAFMSYSAFLGECDLEAEGRRYEDLMTRAEGEMA